MLSFTAAVRRSSHKRRKARPYSACSVSPSQSSPLLCARDGRLGRVNLPIACSPPPESVVPCLPPSALLLPQHQQSRNSSIVLASAAVQGVGRRVFY